MSLDRAMRLPKEYLDAVIELADGEWCAFEIKLGANQIEAAAEGLKKKKRNRK